MTRAAVPRIIGVSIALTLALVSCTQHDVAPVDHGEITSLWLIPNTEGSSVMFCPHPEAMRGPTPCSRLSSVSQALPETWPSPSSSTDASCPSPYRIVVNFADRTKLTYGPCGQPESIVHLHDAMTTDAGVSGMMPPPGASFAAVDGSSADDIWAVGASTEGSHPPHSFAEHWDGTSWSVVDLPDVGRVSDVTDIAPDDAWAVADRSILHWDGATWTTTEVPAPSPSSLSAISASSAHDVWATGVRPGPHIGANSQGWSTLVVRYDGHAWTRMKTPDQGTRDNDLMGIEALGPDDVWAAGYSSDVGPDAAAGRTLTMHWDGTKWRLIPAPDPSRALDILWGLGTGRSTVWATGHYRDAQGHLAPLVLRWDGGSWKQVAVPGGDLWSATAVSGANTGPTWVVGSEPTSAFAVAACGLLKCRMVALPTHAHDAEATGVFAVSANDAWLVGMHSAAEGSISPLVEHWDGTNWRVVNVPPGAVSTPTP